MIRPFTHTERYGLTFLWGVWIGGLISLGNGCTNDTWTPDAERSAQETHPACVESGSQVPLSAVNKAADRLTSAGIKVSTDCALTVEYIGQAEWLADKARTGGQATLGRTWYCGTDATMLIRGEDVSGVILQHELTHALLGCSVGDTDGGHTTEQVWKGL